MPVTISLSTVPGKLTRQRGYTMKTIELFGPSLDRESVAISNVADIKAAVARFGAKVRSDHPGTSFQICVLLAKGCRKPNGYDAASGRNGFGQDDFLHLEEGDAAPDRGGDAPQVATIHSA